MSSLHEKLGGQSGLSWAEAARRLAAHGPNVAVPQGRPAWYAVLWDSFKNPFNYVLLFLGTVSYLTDDYEATVVMGVMVTIATGLRFTQEFRSLVQADSLRRLVRNTATVLRSGYSPAGRIPNAADHLATDVFMEELVPGDVVKLSAGDMIPADLRLLSSRDLFVTQAALTGESLPVEKQARVAASTGIGNTDTAASDTPLDRADLCFMGSSVVSGTATAVVLRTGPSTFLGGMAKKLVGQRPATAFDLGLNRVSWILIKFMFVMVPVVFLINGLVKGDWLEAFFFAVAVAVGLTPEMLPMIVNANLARGAAAMAKERTIVKRMSSMQNFGAMDLLCTDKTGTLTQDKVALIRYLDVSGTPSPRVLEHAYLNSLFQTGLKNLIDRAVIDKAREVGLREVAQSYRKIDEVPFDFSRRRMSVVLERNGGGPALLVCKGAVEEMLALCTQVELAEGAIRPFDAAHRAKLKALRDELNDDGLRVIAVAYKATDQVPGQFSADDECGLILSGYIAFLDPPKESSAEALRLLREHGVGVKILTGDNALVAQKVCRDVGLDVRGVLSGSDVAALNDEALRETAEGTTLFAKLDPAQKARVIAALKKNGHTVGFMGDGINDALALREADVGISVDSAVDVAKEAADIILLEKSLLVLERGVLEGRRVFGNIMKYIKMTASSNFGNVFSVLVASAFLPFLPMLAIHLLIQNLLYDFSQLSIPWDRVDKDWTRLPRKWSAAGIARFMLWVGPVSSLFDITTYLGLWFIFKANAPEHAALFQSGWFIEGLLTQTLIVHMIRTEKIPFVQSRAAWPVVALTAAVMAVGCLVPFTPLGEAVGMQPLPLAYWPFLAATLLGYCLLTQIVKRLYLRKFGEWL